MRAAYQSPVRRLLDRAQPGSRGGVRAHVKRGEALTGLIAARWPRVTRPEQWQAKHLRWALKHALADRSPATRYHYYRTGRALAAAMGRWADWENYLSGPWCHPAGKPVIDRHPGGRPPRLARR